MTIKYYRYRTQRKTYPIVTVREIIDTIHNVEIDGKVYIDDAMKERMEAYLAEYCVK